MSATLLRPAVAAPAEITAVWRAHSGALMMFGHAPSPFPKAGSARVARPASPGFGVLGLFRADFWSAPGGGHAFLAVVRLADHAGSVAAVDLILRGARAADRDVCLRLPAPSGEAEFGRALAAAAGPAAARLVRFMLDVMQPDDDSNTAGVNGLLASFLAAAARRDGCVELILQVPGRCVILQGWGTRLPLQLGIVSTAPFPTLHAAQSGEFARSDLKGASVGSVLALPADALDAIDGQDAIYVLAGDDLIGRNVIERRVLDPNASLGQLRHLLPRLDCPEPLTVLLRSVLQPRFEGVDTLNASARPVRAALDIAAYADEAGLYLSGWLFDPACLVAEISLCAGVRSVRIDDALVRVRRDDVAAAFVADAAFPKPSNHQFGFTISVPIDLAPDARPFLRFTFIDGEFAFLPLVLNSALPSATRRRLLDSVNLHEPTGIAIVERHLAPFFSRLPVELLGDVHVALPPPARATNAIVVPLRDPKLPRSLVAGLLHDPPSEDEIVVVVTGPEWAPGALDALTSLLHFYEVPAAVLVLREQPSDLAALTAAAAATACANLLLVAPEIAGRCAGWRRALYDADPEAPLICPTVLYEDHSIRFSGSIGLARLDRAPFVRLSVALAGLNASYTADELPRPLEGGTLACCLVRRPALPALVRARRYLTSAGMEAALFHAVSAAGSPGTWLPSVQVIAPDGDGAASPVASLVDGWMLRQQSGEHACAS